MATIEPGPVVADAGPLIHLDELNHEQVLGLLNELPARSTLFLSQRLLQEAILAVERSQADQR